MFKARMIADSILFVVVTMAGFFGLQQMVSEQTTPLLGESSSDVGSAIADSGSQCDIFATDYREYLENADGSEEVFFAGCGGLS